MKQVKYINPTVTATTTTTSVALSYGDSTIDVVDSSSFSVNDYVLIEAQGNEYNEILKIATIPTATQITTSTTVQLPHVSGVVVTKLNYNAYKITKTIGTTTTTVKEDTLDYSNKKNRIEYYDDEGLDSYTYKVYYVNTQLATETLAATLLDEDDFSWITKAKFMAETNLDATYSSYVEEALRYGVEAIRDDLFFIRTLETQEQDVEFDLLVDNFVLADFDGNRQIDKYDLEVYEYDEVTGLKTYLNHKVVRLFLDTPKVVFSETVPSSGKVLVINVPVAQVKYEDYRRSYEKLNKLYAVNYLLGDKTNDTVKNAILDWTAGGTTVSRNPNATKDIIKENEAQITSMLKDLMLKTYVGRTKLRSQYNSLNTRRRAVGNYGYGIMTESGRTY